MARRCTTVPGYGACCNALTSGVQSGQPFRMRTSNGGERCAVCTVVGTRKGGQGFRFRWAKSQACGIGPHGCPALAGAGGMGQTLQLR
jgi:hypothetical protein